MTLRIQTGRISYGGPGRLDITRRGGSVFAPSWDLLHGAKRLDRAGRDGWAWYAPRYTAEMRLSYRRHRAAWDELLSRERVVLVCFCADPERCHRTLLAEILVKLGAVYEGEVTL